SGSRTRGSPRAPRDPAGSTPATRAIATGSRAEPGSVEAGHHVLDAGVLLESVHRQVLAVSGVLEAPVRHLGDERDVAVDPHAPEVQPPTHPHRPTEVLGPDAGGEAVLDAVGPGRGLVLVGE